jgi:hypothetical protein
MVIADTLGMRNKISCHEQQLHKIDSIFPFSVQKK